MSGAAEKLARALDTKDRIAAHSQDHDEHSHHVKEAPVVEAVAELTDVTEEFTAGRPNRDHLAAALEAKDRLVAHGMKLSEEEALWREELNDGMQAALKA